MVISRVISISTYLPRYWFGGYWLYTSQYGTTRRADRTHSACVRTAATLSQPVSQPHSYAVPVTMVYGWSPLTRRGKNKQQSPLIRSYSPVSHGLGLFPHFRQ